MTTLSRWARYYLLYLLTPIPALAVIMAVNSPDPWVDALVGSTAVLVWWLLAMITEENNRWLDSIEREYNDA
jgi:hypothetical protein